MRILSFLLVMFFVPFTATAQEKTDIAAMPAGLYKLDKTHASIVWKVNHLGLSDYTARFTKFEADLRLNPTNLESSKIIVNIDPTSIKTDYPEPEKKDFDAQLINDAGWFNAAQFPKITFTSTKVEKTGDDTGKVTGDLTFMGVTKPVTLDVKFNAALGNHPFANKPAVGFSATGTIKRSDFGMTKYIPQIGDEVKLLIEVEFMYAE